MKRTALLGTVSAIILLTSACSGSADEDELVVAAFGGAYNDVLEANAKKFEEETGTEVTLTSAAGSTALAKARSGEIDVLISDPIYSARGAEQDLWSKVEPDDVSNVQNLYDAAKISDYTVAHDYGGYGIAYNPDMVNQAPRSWADLWDPEHCNELLMRPFRPDTIELLVLMAEMNGGSVEDIDPGFEKLAELAPCVHTWSDRHAQALNLFRSEQVHMGVWSGGRTQWANDEGANLKFVIPKEGTFPQVSTMNVVKAGNVQLARQYVQHELSPDPQLRMARELNYFPSNANVRLPTKVQQQTPLKAKDIENLEPIDWQYIVTVIDDWRRRFETDVQGSDS